MASAVDASSTSSTTAATQPPPASTTAVPSDHPHTLHAHHHSTSSTASLPSPITPAKTNQDLAALLTQAYGDNDSLRKELASARKRAEKAERLAQSLTNAVADGGTNGNGAPANGAGGTASLSEATVRLIRDLEERAQQAENAREESESKRRMLLEHWAQVDGYLGTLEYKASEARTNFGRILRESAFSPPGQGFMPPPPISTSSKHSRSGSRSQMVMFPAPTSPVTTRRQRTPSMDGAYPPSKRPRGEDYPPTPRFAYSESAIHDPRHASNSIRVIQPSEKYPGHPQGRHTRASSHSSASSMDVDELLLGAAGGANGTGAPLQAQGSTHITSSHRTRHPRGQTAPRPGDEVPQQPMAQQPFGRTISAAGAYPANQSDPMGRKRDTIPTTAPLQQYNTHVFAPPVTGAPIKKSKYSSANLAAQGSMDPSSQASPQAIFPAANADGQRICRQCGQVGRYKDGKCVEKWGPGPMGPGTVCDRCRKKMKRVERRGTLEAQQQAQQAQQAQLAAQAQMQVMHASQIQQHQPHPNTAAGLTRTDTLPISTGSRTERPPKESHIRTQPSASDTPIDRRSPLNGKPTHITTASPLQRSPVGDVTDSDADADAEAEAEAEILGAASIASGTSATSARGTAPASKPAAKTEDLEDGDAEAEVDPEADLLEAVDAAEKNSSAGSTSGAA